MDMRWDLYIPVALASFYIAGFVIAGLRGHKQRVMKMRSSGKSGAIDSCWKEFYIIILIYSVAIITCMDYFLDISVMIHWLEDPHTRNIGMMSLTVLFAQRILSALVFTHHYGFRSGMSQFFDFEIFNLVSISVKFNRPVFGLKKYKILEGLMESFPQLMMQTYYLSKRADDDEVDVKVFHTSIAISLLSLAMCYLVSDVYGIDTSVKRQTCLNMKNFFRTLFFYGCLGIWRVGEVATRISVCVAFASVVSARKGTVGITSVLLGINFIFIWSYDETIKATIFYHKKRLAKNIMLPKLGLEMTETASYSQNTVYSLKTLMTEQTTDLCENKTESVELIEGTISEHNVKWKEMDKEIKELQEELSRGKEQRCKRWKEEFAGKLFTITNYVGVGVFASLALPCLVPSSYVKLYYLFKIIFECVIIGWCVYQTGSVESTQDLLNLFHILRTQVFGDIWHYWSIGTVFFICGGLLSYFLVIDAKKWKEILEPNDKSLFERMTAKQYDYVDRVIGNRVCTVRDIVQRTVKRKNPNCLDKVDCSLLLCNLLRHGIVELGPKWEERLKDENNIVSALLSDFDHGPSTYKGRRSRLAVLVFCKLLNENDPAVNVSFEDIRNAGVSLTFLRFHLKTPADYFDRKGKFNCTAVELYHEKFDLLFCLKRNFTHEELIDAGFKKDHVIQREFKDVKKCKLKDLRRFGPQLFEMQFYVTQLREAFEDSVVLEWFDSYKSSLQPLERPSDRTRPSHKYGRKSSEPFFERVLGSARTRGSSNPCLSNEKLRRDFTISHMELTEGITVE